MYLSMSLSFFSIKPPMTVHSAILGKMIARVGGRCDQSNVTQVPKDSPRIGTTDGGNEKGGRSIL